SRVRARDNGDPSAPAAVVRAAAQMIAAVSARMAASIYSRPSSCVSIARRKISMKIRDVMTPNPRTVSPNDTVQSAAQVMRAEDTGAVPVVEDGRVLAVVTDRDIVVRVVAEGGT